MFEESQTLEQNNDISIISETSRVSHGKRFTMVEDETLYRSWLAVSQNLGNRYSFILTHI